MNQARAILWGQWRTVRNFIRAEASPGPALIGAGWYGFWLLAAISTARLAASPANLGLMKSRAYRRPAAGLPVLAGGASADGRHGASLELRKLQVYPIPAAELFSIEVMLRVTAAVEMLLIVIGLALGFS